MTRTFLKVSVILSVFLIAPLSANAMNKAELINEIASKSGLDKREATRALNVMLNEIMQTVARGEPVTLSGFGVFNPAPAKQRGPGLQVGQGGSTKGDRKNPQTGKPIIIHSKPPKPAFVPGSGFKKAARRK